jgi:hypothetical protein
MTAPVVAWILTLITSEHIENDDGEVVLNVAGLLVGTGVDEEDEHEGKIVITCLDAVLPKDVVYLTAPC